jgi:hypothetical protein
MVMTNGRQTSGDYGYDLAHEDRPEASAPDASAPDVRPGHEPGSTTPAGSQDEQDQDLGYDEAHDF